MTSLFPKKPSKQDLKPNSVALTNSKLISYLHSELYRLWDVPYRGEWRNPCMNPISMTRDQWKNILQHIDDHVVTEKPDGIMYYLLLTRSPQGKDLSVMIDRSGTMYVVSIVAEVDYFKGTLLVGELSWVQELLAVVPSSLGVSTTATTESLSTSIQGLDSDASRPEVWRQKFKIFSCLCLKSLRMYNQPFQVRHASLCDAISIEDDPLKDTITWLERASLLAKSGKLLCAGNDFCLMFVLKPWQSVRNFSALARSTCQKTNPFDGFIIQNIHMHERPGRRDGCLKWKDVHSLDFGHRGNPKHLFVQHHARCLNANDSKLIRYQGIPVEFIPYQLDNQPDNIGEFVCKILGRHSGPEGDILKVAAIFKESRHEKNSPNDTITVNNTLINIVENLTIEEILKDVDNVIQDARQGISIINLASNAKQIFEETKKRCVVELIQDDDDTNVNVFKKPKF